MKIAFFPGLRLLIETTEFKFWLLGFIGCCTNMFSAPGRRHLGAGTHTNVRGT